MVGKPRDILTNTIFDGLPVDIKDFLNEHANIVVDNFAPIMSISYHTDLIPGSSFPNKVTYRMTPKENEEITNQVQDLLDKGPMRESLSPCVVPLVLILRKDGGWIMWIDSRSINKITIS